MQNYFTPDSPHPIIISKNSVFSFNKYKRKYFFHFWLLVLPEKFSFCPNNNGFARVWGSYAYELAVLVHKFLIGRAPDYLTDDCRLTRHRRPGLRSSSEMMKLEVPSTRTTFGDRSSAVSGPRPTCLEQSTGVNSRPSPNSPIINYRTVFSNRLKTLLFVQ